MKTQREWRFWSVCNVDKGSDTINSYNRRNLIIIISAKRKTLIWTIAVLAMMFVVGCSSPSPTAKPDPENPTTPASQTTPSPEATASPPGTQTTDETKALLLNMGQLAEQGKVINSTFPVKTTDIEDVKKKLGESDKTEWVAAAKGNYATYVTAYGSRRPQA